MRLSRVHLPLEALSWFGLLGAPIAWTAMHVVGYGLTEASCGPAGSRWSIGVDGWTVALTAVAAATAALAGLAAVAAFFRTRGVKGVGGSEEPPPKGRIHFLAVVGIAISPLFLAIIVMDGLGVVFLADCVQS
jgi:hypothetical protein